MHTQVMDLELKFTPLGVTLRVMSLHFVLSLRTAVLSGSLELLDESGGSLELLDESTRFSFLSCADLGQMKI